MASSSSLSLSPPFLTFSLLLTLLLQPQISFSQTCSSSPNLSKNRLFQHCTDLPNLSSHLHWTYNPLNSTLTLAFTAPPAKPNGWISWAINPVAPKMLGSQALIAYKQDNGVMTVKTFNVSSYKIAPSKIDFEVPDMEAEVVDGVMRIYATIVLPKGVLVGDVLNQVWQVGPSVTDGIPDKHDFGSSNLLALGTLDLAQGGISGNGDSGLRNKNIHGILNVVSWGIMFPIGIIIARYLRTFESADPAWFYLHVFCQFSAYVIGVAGWGTGLKLGSRSKGVEYSAHRNIGITLFCFATLQIFALLLRPKKDHKYRIYWNVYHQGVGYAIVVLGILNVFKGLNILDPEKKWRDAYIVVLAVLGGIALLLEIITWIVVLKRKSNKSTKPYDGHNGA